MKFKNKEVKGTKSCSTIISETYQDFAENTSIHGIKYTVKHNIDHYEKLFWILIVLCGLCGSGYMTMLFWDRYRSNPTRTTVLTAYAPTTAIPFPTVTICNINKIMLSKVEAFITELDLKGTEKSILQNAFPQLLAFTHPNLIDYNMTELEILQNVLKNNGHDDITSIMERINQSCEEMLLYCMWNKKVVRCQDVFKKSMSYNGICCSFNHNMGSAGELYSPFSGLGTGLMVLLNPMLQAVQYSPLYSSGFKIHIHSSDEYLGPQCDSKLLPAGRIQYLQILGTKMTCSKSVKDLPINQRHCLYPDELNLKYFGKKYNDDNCLTECEYELYFRQCGCVPFYYTFTDKLICNISKIPCLFEIKLKQMIHEEMKSCKCLPQCENIFYNAFSSSTMMNYNESTSMISFGNTNIIKDTALLNVFFLGNRQIILLRDTITSTIYLLSSFGGVYSLFMGCSLITIIELVYYCLLSFAFKKNSFRKVNIDVKHKDKNKIKNINRRKTRKRMNYPGAQPPQFYYGGVFLP